MASDALFREKAPGIMNLLMADFALDVESAAAILGNLGHESGGFRQMQELRPLSGEGGWGWAQWTGVRRDQFEAYITRNGFDARSDTANYKWLYVELTSTERAAIPAVKNAVGLEAKVKAFELAFERAHKDYKHYPERVEWAQKALEAYRANPGGTIDVKDTGSSGATVIDQTGSTAAPPDALQSIIQQAIAAMMPRLLAALTAALTGRPIELPATPPPVATEKPKTSDTVKNWSTGILGALLSLTASKFGIAGDPVGPAATTTGFAGVILPLIGSTLGAYAPILNAVGPLLSRLAGAVKAPPK
jgi:hypothetical protein